MLNSTPWQPDTPQQPPQPRRSALARAFSWLREPVPAETRELLQQRWQELPAELRSEQQVVGRHLVHCGYSLGPSYCSFGCTHCYLPANANRAPLPTLQEMREQIDANRRLQGPAAGLQITGGDVVDAYLRAGRGEELVQVVRYAHDVGLVPMLMTHGQGLLDHPQLLDQLLVEGRLRKLAIHIDITQAGRPGYPRRELQREADLDPLRDQFVELILAARRRTGILFHAAQTVTVTEGNLQSLGDVLAWFREQPRRLDAFRMVSFQTEADVGRTRFSDSPVTPEAAWEVIQQSLDLQLSRDNLHFGHPACSNMSTVLLRYPRRGSEPARALDLLPAGKESRAFWNRVLSQFGGVGGRGARPWEENLRRLGLLLRLPTLPLSALAYGRFVLARAGLGLRDKAALMADLAGKRLRVLNVVMHNFMSEQEVLAGGAEAQSRLAACSFRGAVRNSAGEWQAVPMCSLNAGQRQSIYQQAIEAEESISS